MAPQRTTMKEGGGEREEKGRVIKVIILAPLPFFYREQKEVGK